MDRDDVILCISIVIALLVAIIGMEPLHDYIYSDESLEDGFPRIYTSFPIKDPDYAVFDGIEYEKDVVLRKDMIVGNWYCIGHIYMDNNNNVIKGVPPDNVTSYMNFEFCNNGTVYTRYKDRSRTHSYNIAPDRRTILINGGESTVHIFDIEDNRVVVLFESIEDYMHIFEINQR